MYIHTYLLTYIHRVLNGLRNRLFHRYSHKYFCKYKHFKLIYLYTYRTHQHTYIHIRYIHTCKRRIYTHLAAGLVDNCDGLRGEWLGAILGEHCHHSVQNNIRLRATYIHTCIHT